MTPIAVPTDTHMPNTGLAYWVFGNLRFHDILPRTSAIALAAALMVVFGAIGVVVYLTWARRWGWLWREWLTSLDHKKIGIMYCMIAFVMMARAIAEAQVIRLHQATSVNADGIVGSEHFAELFSTHGTVMIFFMAMPFLTGIINYVMPLQIGARDLTFPFMNAVGLAFTAAGAAILMASLVVGHFSIGGWSGYPPFTELAFSPGEGVDYWIWAVTLSSLGSTLSGINFAVTLYKERAPGMTLMRMPLFCWTTLCTSILLIFAMPPLTIATLLLALDRYLDFHFFTNAAGGNMMNYANLFWLFGHPEVYILILPAFGVWSEIISTFSGKRLYGYTSMVLAVMCIAVLSFTVWLHHFFTMGQSANVNIAFGIATMLIGIPTGVKVYDWLLTMYRGRIRFSTPLLFAISFLLLFVLGGMSGIVLANPPVDFQVHNSLFLVAHFHNMLIPGTLFGMIAGYMFWFPKAFGFRLDERWGKIAWACWTSGFVFAFMPLYMLGLMGVTRRTAYTYDEAFGSWFITAEIGAVLIGAGLLALFVQLFVSVRRRHRLAVPLGDPWDGHSLEWYTPSPPPEYNFALQPEIHDTEAFTWLKRNADPYEQRDDYGELAVPRNTGIPAIMGAAGFVCAFALSWHVWWAAALGCLGLWAGLVWRSFQTEFERIIPADEIRAQDEVWRASARLAVNIDREREFTPANRGVAQVQT